MGDIPSLDRFQAQPIWEMSVEAGCDYGSPGTCDGEFSIDFHRTAGTLEEAIISAIANVKSAGYEVERVEIEAGAMPQPA
jgi:hypothetical protein